MDAKVYTASKSLIGLRDNAARMIREHADLPRVRDYSQGQLDAYDIALSAMAGVVGFLTREAFELAVRLEGEARAEAKQHQARPLQDAILAQAQVRQEREAFDQATAHLEPMGGWEPRS